MSYQYAKFKENPCVGTDESTPLMKNVHMCYIRVTEGKIENLKKEGKMRISTLVFIYTIHFSYLKVHK